MNNSGSLSIRRFFAGKNVLVTGATGFLAKALVEKLLRSLPGLGQIYLLIRPRFEADGSQVDATERLRTEILRNSAFNRLREEWGADFERRCDAKIVCVEGDLTQEKFGLDDAAFDLLGRKINVIINSAATVVFDERLDLALSLNTLGPSRLLPLARLSGAVLVHVSTAYVSGMRSGLVPERLLDPLQALQAQLPAHAERPATFEVREVIAQLRKDVQQVQHRWQDQITAKGLAPDSEEARKRRHSALVHAGMKRAQQFGWNDTYTFTKFLGEQLLFLERGTVPLAIVRPSIIESTLAEPEPGWLDGLRMADPIIIGFGKGRLPDFPAKLHVVLDIIPADFVANAVLAAGAGVARHPDGFDLFTIASSSQNPLAFRELYAHVRQFFQDYPLTDKAGDPIPVPDWKFPDLRTYQRRLRFRYLLPARLANALLSGRLTASLTRKWRARWRAQISKLEQLLYYADIYGPYLSLDCCFETSHAAQLLQSLEPDERRDFNFDVGRIDWREYLQRIHIPGLKRNILRLDSATPAGEIPALSASPARDSPGTNSALLPPPLRQLPRTVVELSRRGRDDFGAKPFLEITRHPSGFNCQVTRLSFAELYERSRSLAGILTAKLGLHAGDRVALIGDNGPEWALAYLAIAQAGATVVPLDRLMTPEAMAKLVRLVEAQAVIASPPVWELAAPELAAGQGPPPVLNLWADLNPFPGQQWSRPAALPDHSQLQEPAPDSLASILFTSGTTLDPKGVMLSHANFIADALGVAKVLAPKLSDRFLSVLPLHHGLEFTCGLLIPMFGGSSVHYLEKLRAQSVVDTMRQTRVTVVIGVPRLFKLFMDNIQSRIKAAGPLARLYAKLADKLGGALEMAGAPHPRRRLFAKVHAAFGGHIRLFVSGGAPLDPQIYYFFQRLGIPIYEGYGLTETSPVLTVNPLGGSKAGSVGKAIPGVELRIRQLDGDGVGEVLARGPTIMQGYWHNRRATEAAFDGSWLKTGDLGRVDPQGYLHLTGRLNDMILTGTGENVYPDEVEHALRDVPGVRELCVLGLPSRLGFGQEVAAVVVPENAFARQEISTAIGQVNRTLASHQRVARIEFQEDELPKTSTLKVQRHKLRAWYSRLARPDDIVAPAATPPVAGSDPAPQRHDLENEVTRILAKMTGRLSPPQILPQLQLQMDLGLDSIGLLDLAQQLESRLGVALPEGAEATWFTVRDVQLVARQAAKAGADHKRRHWFRGLRGKGSAAKPRGLMWASGKPLVRQSLQGVFNTWVSFLLHTYWRVSFQGRQNVPPSGSFILAANHCSHLDSVVLRALLGKRANHLCFMAAKDYFFGTALKRWFVTTFLNALPFDRKANPAESLATCKAALDKGNPIVLFPEGTRSLTGELQQFKPGIGVLAVELDVPLIPVFLQGTFQAWPKGRRFPKPGPIEVRIGPAIDLHALKTERGHNSTTELYRQAASTIRNRIEALAEPAAGAETT